MRRVAVLLAIAACGHDKNPAPDQESAATTKPVETKKPITKGMVMANVSATAGKLDPVGPLAAQPAAPTLEAVKKRACASAAPVELGTTDRSEVAVAFGPKSGIVAWSPNGYQLAIRAIDRTGKPLGEAHVVEAPARVSSAHGIRALDGHYIVFLSDFDFSGPSPLMKLYAVLTDAEGVPSAHITQVAIGNRGMVDDVSPAGTRGVLVWAGPTPATNIDKGRLISLTGAGKDSLAQSYIDFADPAPGTRAFPFYSFGEHAVTVIGPDVIVDSEVKPRTDDKAYTPDGLVFAPTFTGSSVPVLGMPLGRDATTLRYGALGLDGAFHFDKADVPKTRPLKAPFEEHVKWLASGKDVTGATDIGGTMLDTSNVPDELSGETPQVTWSGEQILLVSAKDGKVRVAALPCAH